MQLLYDHTGALFLIILSYIIPLLFSSIRNNKYLVASFFIVITAHQLISLLNYFVLTLPGADLDANTFHINAWGSAIRGEPPGLHVGTGGYENILYYAYSLFGANKLVGQSLSILIAVVSCLMILRIAQHLSIRRNLVPALLIIGFTPSFLLYTSLTFREVFQVMGLVGGIYFAYEAFTSRSTIRLLISSVFFIFMGLFHQVLLAISFLLNLITLTFYFLYSGAQKKIFIRNIVVATIAIVVVAYFMLVNIPTTKGKNYLTMLIENGSVVEMIGDYRRSIESVQPRSAYKFDIDTTSIVTISYGLSVSYIHYLFGPWVTSIEKPIDLIPFVNSLGRILVGLLLLYLLIKKISITNGSGYLLVVYLCVTIMWSIGTTNYGQAFRHHSLTDWILALIFLIGIQALRYKREQPISYSNESSQDSNIRTSQR